MPASLDSPSLTDLQIIGSQVVPHTEDLPRRLIPIYARQGEPDVCYVPLDPEDDAPPRLGHEPRSWIDEQVEAGEFVLFETPIPARPGHWLLQLHPDQPPAYLPAAQVDACLQEEGSQALDQAARSLERSEAAQAEAHLWYAARALPEDPLPLLALTFLLGPALPPERFGLLELELERYPATAIEQARDRLQKEPRYAPIGRLQTDPPERPLLTKVLSYLAPFPERVSVRQMRQAWST